MNINYLEYVAAVARTGSISRAAKELLLSQPYLSGVIKSVEKELEIQIFQRTNKGMEPTELGKEFLCGVERILTEWHKLQGLKIQRGGQLRVASYYSPFFMQCFLEMRTGDNASNQDSFREMSLIDCFRALYKESADLALICYADCAREYYKKVAASYHCQFYMLFSGAPLQIIMNPNHPLAKQTFITVEDLQKYPFVCYRDSLSLLRLLGLENHPNLMQVTDRGTYFDMIQDGGYLSFIAIVADGEPVKQELCYIPLSGQGLLLQFSYAVRDSYQISLREKEFLRLIRAKARIDRV